jgi:hypothetical protein
VTSLEPHATAARVATSSMAHAKPGPAAGRFLNARYTTSPANRHREAPIGSRERIREGDLRAHGQLFHRLPPRRKVEPTRSYLPSMLEPRSMDDNAAPWTKPRHQTPGSAVKTNGVEHRL